MAKSSSDAERERATAETERKAREVAMNGIKNTLKNKGAGGKK